MPSASPVSRPIVVAMTGATGAVYGIRLLEALRELGVETHLVVSRWAEVTPERATTGMVVAPCSMRTLAAIAHGLRENLVQQAAAVHLQEGRRLVLLVRESPLSVVHLENMLLAARAGAVIAPPLAAFYARLESLDEMVDHTVGRTLDSLGVEHERIRRWGERRGSQEPSAARPS
jgi:4-hydroxy-3-polyprenylbenzoate decarboxylase